MTTSHPSSLRSKRVVSFSIASQRHVLSAVDLYRELLTLFVSVAFYGESPLEPIQILWINLVTGAMVAIRWFGAWDR